MNVGTVLCLILGGSFLLLGILFAVLKEKGAILLSGFNSYSKEEREKFNQAAICKDTSNNFFIWFAVFLIGAILSHFIFSYSAIVAFIVWLVLFIKDCHLDVEKAFGKYRL